MKLTYNRLGNVLVFRLRDGPIHHSEEVEPGVYLLFDSESEVLGLELRSVRGRMSVDDLIGVSYENAETSKRASLKLP